MKIKLIKFHKVKSTNDVAMRLIKQNSSKPTLILSKKQINGRGRIGKKWISKNGNLFISIFFRLDELNINYKQFSVLNALLFKKLISEKISKKITIKWPNDLLFKKKKFCGILQEVIKYRDYKYLIVGIGINTNSFPKNKSFQSTSLKNIIDQKVDNQKFLKNILIAYEKFLSQAKKKTFLELKRKYK